MQIADVTASILLVDDDPRNLVSLEAILESPDRRLVKARSGEEALRQLLREDYAVILLDVHLGGIDGFETAALIRQRERSRLTPIIFLTADNRSAGQAAKGYALGAVDYLLKPFSPDMLRAKVAVFVDVFRKTAEIQRQSDIFAAVMASISEGLILLDVDGRIQYCNARAGALLGCHPAALMGLDLAALVTRFRAIFADPGLVQVAIQRVRSRLDEAPSFDVSLVGPSPRDLRVQAFPVMTGGARPQTGLMLRDVTADRLVKQLAETRALYEAAALNLTDGLAILDRDDRVLVWNPRMEVFCGVPNDQAVGRSVWEVTATLYQRTEDPEETLRRSRAARGASLEGTPTLFAYRLNGRDGEPARDLTTLDFPIRGTDGTVIGLGQLVRDVTREREVERLKDELVGVVSHELRTPLASLVGFADLLLTRDYDEAERHQFLSIMVEEGERLTTLINDFLDLQRMESGRYQVNPTATQLVPLLERAAVAAGEDPDRPIQCDVPDEFPLVRADANAILQVLSNLLSNARKYSPNGGAIALSARVVDNLAEVAVIDQGLGLPPEALPRLFEKFYRVDNSDRRTIKGTGLGLAICRKIIEAHGGRIGAESAGLGRGARVRFTLPLAHASRISGDVLVVEDDLAFAHLLEAELVARGLSAVAVKSAEAALEQFVSARPRAVLLDLVLPGMPGEEFLHWLRELGEGEIPVVVITAKDLDAPARRSLYQLGVVAIHHKSSGVAPLAAGTVERVLNSDKALARRSNG